MPPVERTRPSCPWSHGLRPKKLSVSVTVPPAPVRVPSQRPLAPSIMSVMSVANDKGDNEMIPGTVHRFPGICLTAYNRLHYFQVGMEIEVRPGLVSKDSEGKLTCKPIFSRIVSLFAEQNELQFAVPGGLIGNY